jgi:hypothetical protein
MEEQRKVRIIAIAEKFRKAPIYIAPEFDSTTVEFRIGKDKYKGKIDKNAEGNIAVYEHEGDMPFRLTDQDMYRIQHMSEFDLTNGQEAMILKIARNNSEFIAESKQAINPLVHRFYIENIEEESKASISRADKIADAISKIKSMGLEEMVDFSRLVKAYSANKTKLQIESSLSELAITTPQIIIDAFNDANRKQKIFLDKLVREQVVTLTDKTKYMFGSEIIGINEDYALQYLSDPKNLPIIEQWNSLLKKKKK